MSYDEIAATLEVSVAKVKSDLFRARQALRAAFGRTR
jgi:DNA-directed RNA polymerase specialized sigma24 family protein